MTGEVEPTPPGNSLTLRGRKALVTGGTGFIGANLVRKLVGAGCKVAVLARPGRKLEKLAGVTDKVTLLPGDVSSREAMEAIDPAWASDIVFHLAAAGVGYGSGTAEEMVHTNCCGTFQVLELARRGQAKRFVYCGSCSEYGSGRQLGEDAPLVPDGAYAVSKVAGWMLAESHARSGVLPVVSLRIFTPYGPFDSPRRLIPHTILSALAGKDVALTSGEQTRDFVYVEDVCEAFLLAAVTPDAVGQTVNICTGQETSVIDVVKVVLDVMGNPVKALPGAIPSRPDELRHSSGDPTRASHVLGWTPRTPLREGIARAVEWFRQQRGGLER